MRRYSGNTEVRLRYDRDLRTYIAVVSDPKHVWRGRLRGTRTRTTNSSEIDALARRFILAAESWAKTRKSRYDFVRDALGRPKIRRTFQAPCPM